MFMSFFFDILFFFFYCYGDLRDLHSFPTRRSSDLTARSGVAATRWSRRNAGVRARTTSSRRSGGGVGWLIARSEEHTSELQSRGHLVCRLLLEKKKKQEYNLHNLIHSIAKTLLLSA